MHRLDHPSTPDGMPRLLRHSRRSNGDFLATAGPRTTIMRRRLCHRGLRTPTPDSRGTGQPRSQPGLGKCEHSRRPCERMCVTRTCRLPSGTVRDLLYPIRPFGPCYGATVQDGLKTGTPGGQFLSSCLHLLLLSAPSGTSGPAQRLFRRFPKARPARSELAVRRTTGGLSCV